MTEEILSSSMISNLDHTEDWGHWTKVFLRTNVFTGYSSIPYTTTLNLWSVGEFTLEAKGLMLVTGYLEFTDFSAERLTFLMKAIVSARSFSSSTLWIASLSTFEEQLFETYITLVGFTQIDMLLMGTQLVMAFQKTILSPWRKSCQLTTKALSCRSHCITSLFFPVLQCLLQCTHNNGLN